MIEAIKLAKFAEKNGWIVINKKKDDLDNFIRYLTPQGQIVSLTFWEDGSIHEIIS